MTKPILLFISAICCSVMLFGSNEARAFGEPGWVEFNYDPAIASGCLRWNWQQYSYYDHCPVYVRPKAYVYPRFRRTVLRTKG